MAAGTKLEKAYLTLLQPSTSGGKASGGTQSQVVFQFNPKEYSIQKTASWESKPARSAEQTAVPDFKGAEPASMTLEVFLDATDSGASDITKDIETLMSCCGPLKETVDKNTPSPPFVLFGWGKTAAFTAFVKQVSVRYSMFKPDGAPLRATVSLTLQEIPSDKSRQNPTSGGVAARRAYTVVTGDSLPSVSFREYGKPGLWRALAEVNAIDDPMRLPAGTRLLVPPPDEARTLAGAARS